MFESGKTIGQVLEQLRTDKHLTPEQVERCAGYLEERRLNDVPTYVRALTAIGAVLAAGIFVPFTAMIGNQIGPVPLGFLFVAGALFLTYIIDNAFARDMAIAFSIGGQFAIIYGVGDQNLFGTTNSSFWQMPVAAILLCVALYPFFTSPVHRFLTCSVAIGLTVAWMLEAEQPYLLHLAIFAEAIGAALLMLNSRYYDWMKPLAYSLAAAFPVTVMVLTGISGGHSGNPQGMTTPLWPTNVLLATGILVLIWWVARDSWYLVSEPSIVVAVAVIAIAAIGTPGILAAIGMLLLGYALSDQYIIVLGVLFLLLFLGFYYYDMDVSLLVKSGILASSGLILLTVRFVLARRWWTEGELS